MQKYNPKNKKFKDFTNLIIWQKAHEIFEMVCSDVSKWRKTPVANSITFQVLGSSGSIGATVAEGYGRGTPKEFEQFLRYARGSLAETTDWMIKAHGLKLISDDRLKLYQQKFEEWKKINAVFVSKLRNQKRR
jgi:four helix bundle protein